MSKVHLAARREGAERVQSRHLVRFELRLKEDRKRCRDTMVRLASATGSALSEEPAFTWDPAECCITYIFCIPSLGIDNEVGTLPASRHRVWKSHTETATLNKIADQCARFADMLATKVSQVPSQQHHLSQQKASPTRSSPWQIFIRLALLLCIVSAISKVSLPPSDLTQWLGVSSPNVLILTAHPDDECMFFAPVILALVAQGIPVRALSLSTGE